MMKRTLSSTGCRRSIGCVVAAWGCGLIGCIPSGSSWGPDSQSRNSTPVSQRGSADTTGTTDAKPTDANPASNDKVDEDVRGFLDRLARYDAAPSPPARGSARPASEGEPQRNNTLTQDDGLRTTANEPLQLNPAGTSAPGTDTKTLTPPRPAPEILSVVIHSDEPLRESGDDAPTQSTNAALTVPTASNGMAIDRYVEWLQQQIDEAPHNFDARWRLALQQLALGRQPASLAKTEGEPTEARGFLDGSLDLIDKLRRAGEDPARGSNDALEALNEVRTQLQGQADLKVPTVQLCSRVTGFGVYEVMPARELVPYRSNRTIVYLEIENFRSDRTAEEQWRTRLTCRMELLTSDGRSLWTHEQTDIEDLSRRRRNDFFLAQLVTLPPSLSPGEYVLKVTVEDGLASKVNEGLLTFAVSETSALTAARSPNSG